VRSVCCVCLAFVGGNWNDGVNAGPFYWNLNNSLGNSNVNIGARHSMKSYKNVLAPQFLSTCWKMTNKGAV